LPSLGAQAVTHALGLIGSPYRYGGMGPSGIDCSGLVRYSYQLVGITLPRATGEQRAATRRLPPAEALRAGDLVFFSRGKTALHVGLFAGDGRFVHAATRGGGVRLETLAAPHWRQRFLEARRVAPPDGDPEISAVADRR
jgi:cell wall-associated NlpC family hydrolase